MVSGAPVELAPLVGGRKRSLMRETGPGALGGLSLLKALNTYLKPVVFTLKPVNPSERPWVAARIIALAKGPGRSFGGELAGRFVEGFLFSPLLVVLHAPAL